MQDSGRPHVSLQYPFNHNVTPQTQYENTNEIENERKEEGEKDEVHASSHTPCVSDTCENERRLFTVRWASTTAETNNQASIFQALRDKRDDPLEKESRNDSTAHLTSPVEIDERHLSLEILLRESQQQLKEIMWHKRQCRTLQVTLDAANERQKSLEDALLETRTASLYEREQHRAFVAAASDELRVAKDALETKASAVCILEEELRGMHRELERFRRLNEKAESDRAAWWREKNELVEKVACMLTEKRELHEEVEKWRLRCMKLEHLQKLAKTGEKDEAATICSNNSNEGEDGKERNTDPKTDANEKYLQHEFALLMLREELNRREMEIKALEEFNAVYIQYRDQTYRLTSERLLALWQEEVKLTAVLALAPTEPIQVEDKKEKRAKITRTEPIAVFFSNMQRVEEQWNIIEALCKRQTESFLSFRHNLQQEVEATVVAHTEKLQHVQSALQQAQESGMQAVEERHSLEVRHVQMLQAVERQCRLVLTSVAAETKRREHGTSSDDKKANNVEDFESKSADQQEVQFLYSSPLEDNKRVLENSHDVEFLTPEYEERVRAIMHRAYHAMRLFTRQLREERMQQESLVSKMEEERQRVLVSTHQERVRHQNSMKRLKSAFDVAKNAESLLQERLAAVTRSAEAERQLLQRRAEIAEREVHVREKQERVLQRHIQEVQQQCEAARTDAATQKETVTALETRLTEQQNTAREEHFDVCTLRHRCDDLVRIVDALEAHVRREEQHQLVLHELLQQFCGAIALLTLRLNTVSAERRVMCRIYQMQDVDSRTTLKMLHDLENELCDDASRPPAVLQHRASHSLRVVCTVVVASCRMQSLLRYRQNRRHVTFAQPSIHTTAPTGHKAHISASLSTSSLTPCLVAPNSLHRLVSTVSVASMALLRRSEMVGLPVVRLPALPTLLSSLKTTEGRDSHALAKCYTLQRVLALAEVDTTLKDNIRCFAEHTLFSDTFFFASTPPVVVRPSRSVQETLFRSTITQKVHSFALLVRQKFTELRRNVQQQEARVEFENHEKYHLAAALQKKEQLLAGFAQKLHDYEQCVETSYVSRAVHDQLQQGVTSIRNALQEEREARRNMEEVNVTLRQRDLELTKSLQHMRNEVRSLQIELAEQKRPVKTPFSETAAAAAVASMRIQTQVPWRKRRNGDSSSPETVPSSAEMYVPRSVQLPEERDTLFSTGNTVEFSEGGHVGSGIPTADDAFMRIIDDIESRLGKTRGRTPLQGDQTQSPFPSHLQ